jgi:selenide, water dikinase
MFLIYHFKLVEDPYKQGEIACCNVLSDIYAMGVTDIDNVLMILGVSLLMKEDERKIITKEIMRGFNDKANQAGTKVTGGQSVMNPWPMIGGTAISVVKKNRVKFPNNAKAGDKLILTKPLGTQVCVNLVQWFIEKKPAWEKSKEYITENEMWKCYYKAEESMSRLNINGARLMEKYKIGACTDVTGFGIKGHCENLAKAQKEELKFVINLLPIFPKMDLINDNVFNFKLSQGYSAETSGGLLIAIDKEDAENYVEELARLGERAWIVGEIIEGNREVEISKDFKLLYV